MCHDGYMCGRYVIARAAGDLMDALGIEEVPYGRLDLTIGAVDRDREERGLPPLA